MTPPPDRNQYTVGWIAPIALELTAATAVLDTSMLDEEDQTLHVPEDDTIYNVGKIGKHYVVMVVCPRMGTNPATAVVTNMRRSFPGIKHILVVGIAGGVPSYGTGSREQIVLGDVVVSVPQMSEGGVTHYEFGAWVEDKHEVRGHMLHPSSALLGAVHNLRTRHSRKPGTQIPLFLRQLRENIIDREQSEFNDPGPEQDRLFQDHYPHLDVRKFCRGLCDLNRSTLRNERGDKAVRDVDTPFVHYGTIGSANSFMASSSKRNELHEKYGIICFEMEAAGIMSEYQGLVIRGICDYSDSHTNKEWQKYAAATAAAYGKELICFLPSTVLSAPAIKGESILST
jgi:nucleoside phosphorylase